MTENVSPALSPSPSGGLLLNNHQEAVSTATMEKPTGRVSPMEWRDGVGELSWLAAFPELFERIRSSE